MKTAEKALFGTAGSPAAFYADRLSASADMPRWLADKGLDAYEYSAGRGMRLRDDAAALLGAAAAERSIVLSLHAPYFINLATTDQAQQEKNLHYLMSSINAAALMKAGRVVFHAGGQGKAERTRAFGQVKKNLGAALEELSRRGMDKTTLLPETMGKKGQIGSLAETVELCRLWPEMLLPAVDFGHLHAITGGGYIAKSEYLAAFDYIGENLGPAALRNLHVHFSCIEFTGSGEKKHWSFSDPYGPPFEPFIEAVLDYGLAPLVICESAGTQDIDAQTMKNYYMERLPE
ncbi:MAG: TIM barrel protein [Acidaminococcales bacterium]|jgi:deoxyribonuclease-4|nr:TIM barrel protein [Acidaminococcales bacterium]